MKILERAFYTFFPEAKSVRENLRNCAEKWEDFNVSICIVMATFNPACWKMDLSKALLHKLLTVHFSDDAEVSSITFFFRR